MRLGLLYNKRKIIFLILWERAFDMKKLFSNAKWILPHRFAALEPVDPFHREGEKKDIELPDELKNLHIIYRASFSLERREKAVIRISADDYYKLKINGVFVGQGPAQSYFFHYYWNEYDISDLLCVGQNEISVDLYYQGLINRAYNSGDRRIGLIAEVFSGNKLLCASSESWECALDERYIISHTIGYNTAFAENVDLRRDELRFERCEAREVDYTFSERPAIPLSVYRKVPQSVKAVSGGYQYDFGEELTGGVSIKVRAAEGEKITILSGEELYDDTGRVRYEMRCNSRCEEYIICREGENEYTQYEYKGFRYVEVLCENEMSEILELSALVRHYPFDDSYCRLETDNEILRSVWDICARAVKYGSQETYIDCPTREKGQYAGDMVITSAAQLILSGDASLLRKAIDDLSATERLCEGLLGVATGSFSQEIADYSLQFPILALRYYEHTKDLAYLAENLGVCDRIIKYFKKFAREDGLLEDVSEKWNLVDWPDNLRDGYDFPLTNPIEKGSGAHNVINAFYIGCVMGTEEIRSILGADVERESDRLIAAFDREFFDSESGLYRDSARTTHSSLHSNVIPLYYGISRDHDEQRIADFICERKLCCGVYVAYFLLKALCRVERYEDALALILSTDRNSWYNMVREGATTCFEAWGKDQKWNTSLCHPWACAPISLLAEDILPNMKQVGKIIFIKNT